MVTAITLPPSTENESIRKLGRPKSNVAKSPAQRSREYRTARRAEGLTAVKCFLTQAELAYLQAICKIENIDQSRAIGMAIVHHFCGNTPVL